MLRIAAMAAIAVLLLTSTAISEEDVQAGSPETSLLCVSKCEPCPVVCLPPPSPPKASGSVIPPPPAKKSSPPPPTSSSSSSSPAGGQDQGGLSYPYYYFYTADAAAMPPGLFLGLLGLFPLLVVSLWML